MRNRILRSSCETLASSNSMQRSDPEPRWKSAALDFGDVDSPWEFPQGLSGYGHMGQPIMQSS